MAALNCSTVARPASTLNRRLAGLAGRAAKTVAPAAAALVPPPVRRTTPPRTPPIRTTVVGAATIWAGIARVARGQSPLPTHAHGFDRQAVPAPGERTIKERGPRKLAAVPGPLAPVPAPAQVDPGGQRGAGAAPLLVDQLPRTPGEEHDADAVGSARGQRATQGVHRAGGQGHGARGQRARWIGWFTHPPSIAKLWPLLLLNW